MYDYPKNYFNLILRDSWSGLFISPAYLSPSLVDLSTKSLRFLFKMTLTNHVFVYIFMLILFLAQARVFLAKQMGINAPGMEGMLDNMVNEFIRVQDLNQDGRISQGEFAKPTKKHDEL